MRRGTHMRRDGYAAAVETPSSFLVKSSQNCGSCGWIWHCRGALRHGPGFGRLSCAATPFISTVETAKGGLYRDRRRSSRGGRDLPWWKSALAASIVPWSITPSSPSFGIGSTCPRGRSGVAPLGLLAGSVANASISAVALTRISATLLRAASSRLSSPSGRLPSRDDLTPD